LVGMFNRSMLQVTQQVGSLGPDGLSLSRGVEAGLKDLRPEAYR
jgi:hypothetical protein